MEWPNPKTMGEVHSFHGLATFYRRFFKGCSAITAPLINCLKKDHFVWDESVELSFIILKIALTTSQQPLYYPYLILRNCSKLIVMQVGWE